MNKFTLSEKYVIFLLKFLIYHHENCHISMKNLLILLSLISFSSICIGQNPTNPDKKSDIVQSSCSENQICCYYNTHSPIGWDLKCLSREECENLSGTIFDADKCVVISGDKTNVETPK
jgi:hypothetical protein